MLPWIEIGILNALSATVLAAVAALVTWRVRRPAVVHTVWVIVLAKLVSVPILELQVDSLAAPLTALRASSASTLSSSLAHGQTDTTDLAHGTQTRPARETAHEVPASESSAPGAAASIRGARTNKRSAPFDAHDAARWAIPTIAWAGAVFLIVLWGVRTLRFRRRLLRHTRLAPELAARVDMLAQRLGVRRPPRVRLVPERIPPSLFALPGGTEILLPQALLQRLSPDELDTLLAHELAHLRRRDHWTRALELVAGALFWWHPVAWWARRHVRIAAEQSCDDLVKRALPTRARDYAETLLKTVEFLSAGHAAVPALATGAGETRRLEERMTMILDRTPTRPLSGPWRALLLALAVPALLVSPVAFERGNVDAAEPKAPTREPQAASPEEDEANRKGLDVAEKRMLELQREQLRLERQFAELELERAGVREQLEVADGAAQAERLRAEIQRLEAEGDAAAVRELRQQMQMQQAESAIRREQLALERRHMRLQMDAQFEMRRLELELRRAEAAGSEEQRRALKANMQEMQARLREVELEMMRGELENARRRLEFERAQLENTRRVR